MVDVYDANRRLTGRTVPRAGAHMAPGEFLLYVLAVVQDAQGRYLITQRSADKSWAAGWWEVQGGGARAGETSAQAVVREVREEVGLDVSGQPLAPIFSYVNDEGGGDNYFVDAYRFQLDVGPVDVRLQAEEAVDFRFATWEEIEQLAAAGTFLHFGRLQAALA